MNLVTKFLPETITYTGAEMRPHWIAGTTGIFGNALVAFRGPCRVKSGEMVDVEDANRSLFIESQEMLHFIGENFGESLETAISNQRLFIAAFCETLAAGIPGKFQIGRQGDDLFVRESGKPETRKLSVSIVTASAVSTLLHFGVNINPAGAPVAAIGLEEMGFDANAVAQNVLNRWAWEVDSMRKARCKASPR